MNRMYVLIIDVPDPTLLLTSNQRLHWRRKAERTAHWREIAGLQAKNAMRQKRLVPLERALIQAWFTWPTKHRRDPANWYPTIKACVDGIVDAGVLPADDFRHLDGPDLRRDLGTGPTSIRLEITDLGEAA